MTVLEQTFVLAPPSQEVTAMSVCPFCRVGFSGGGSPSTVHVKVKVDPFHIRLLLTSRIVVLGCTVSKQLSFCKSFYIFKNTCIVLWKLPV